MFLPKRGLHSCRRVSKDITKYIKQSTKEGDPPKLEGSPTIYNERTSAANYKGFLKAKIPAGLYYNPAQSSTMNSINSETIPVSFMPKDDPRRPFAAKLHATDKLESQTAPPVLCSKSTLNPSGKSYHLKPEQIKEIQRLRAENPEVYTRKALAAKYNVSPLFISMVSDVPKERKLEMDRRLETIKTNWHPKRAAAREDRRKRKEMWYRV